MNETKICIYCLGEYGIQTYYKLKEAGIQINYFGDRDKQKQGYVFDGLYCLSYEQVSALDKMTTILIVAVKKPDELIDDFKHMGFVHVYTKEQGIAPGIVVGRMQLEGMIKYSMLNNLKEKYEIAV